MTKLYSLREVSGVYADAFVGDSGNNLLFLSVWGFDTSIQEFLARLSLSRHENGIESVTLESTDESEVNNDRHWFNIHRIGNFQKLTTRSTSKDSLFHHKVHLWLYDKFATMVDHANHRCLLFKTQTEDDQIFSNRLWEAVKIVCPVPLLDEWEHIMEKFRQECWIKHHEGIQVDAYKLDFSGFDVEDNISKWIREGLLILPKKKSHLAIVK